MLFTLGTRYLYLGVLRFVYGVRYVVSVLVTSLRNLNTEVALLKSVLCFSGLCLNPANRCGKTSTSASQMQSSDHRGDSGSSKPQTQRSAQVGVRNWCGWVLSNSVNKISRRRISGVCFLQFPKGVHTLCGFWFFGFWSYCPRLFFGALFAAVGLWRAPELNQATGRTYPCASTLCCDVQRA